MNGILRSDKHDIFFEILDFDIPFFIELLLLIELLFIKKSGILNFCHIEGIYD